MMNIESGADRDRAIDIGDTYDEQCPGLSWSTFLFDARREVETC